MTEKEPKRSEGYLEEFSRLEQRSQPQWLFPLRKAGIASFAEQGFPTLQHEDWRYTNIDPITRLPFHPVFDAPADSDVDPEQAVFASLSGPRLVFVNGHFSARLSSAESLLGGIRVESLARAMETDEAFLQKHLGRYAQIQGNAFAALNQAFFLDGAFVYVPAGAVVKDPIRVVYICANGQPGTTVHPRNLIVAEAGSQVTIVETYLSQSGGSYLTNAVTEVTAASDARVELVKVQDEASSAYHVATIQGRFGRTSNVRVHSFALGARLSRNNIRVHLDGEGLECVLNGLYLTRDDQLADHHMIVEHAQPHCASHEYFNGILDDRSKGVFHGRILVRQVAQKTDAKQTNKNLLLSDDATADTKPQLEIYADDVKCTHGATIGQLNDESIFYLRSRGIGTDTAKRMLIHAFAGEIIERIQCEPAREELDRVVWDRLEANPHVAARSAA